MKPVIARIPASVTGGHAIEVLFRLDERVGSKDFAIVDVRYDPVDVWTPLEMLGGTIEIRER